MSGADSFGGDKYDLAFRLLDMGLYPCGFVFRNTAAIRVDSLEPQQSDLSFDTSGIPRKTSVLTEHAVTWHYDRYGIVPHRSAYGARRRFRSAFGFDPARYLSVSRRRAERYPEQYLVHFFAERRTAFERQRQFFPRLYARKIRVEPKFRAAQHRNFFLLVRPFQRRSVILLSLEPRSRDRRSVACQRN